MTGRVTSLWRHSIKSHGQETLQSVLLSAGRTMPWDRTWAVAHETSKATNEAWSPCAAFTLVSKTPTLMAITAKLDPKQVRVTPRHPGRPDLTYRPDTDVDQFLAWVAPLMPENRAASTRIVRVQGRGMTDSDFPSVTQGNLSSHRRRGAAGA